jgi:hypothetical protein
VVSNDEESGEVLSLITNRASTKWTEREEESAADDAYGTVKGQRVAATLRLIRRNGKPVSLPYAYLPIVWGDDLPGLVLIEYPGLFTVRLAGDCDLGPLEELLSEHRVTWIRECDEATARSLPLAVTRIDLIRYYPSREVAGDPRTAAMQETGDA